MSSSDFLANPEKVVEVPTSEKVEKTEKAVRVVFWGIVDVKFDPRLPDGERVKVLELGDGRLSKFSHHGKHILEKFQNEYCISRPIKRHLLVENKRCTHDMFLDEGFSELRPLTGVYPNIYENGLAARILNDMKADMASRIPLVLKLCNRSRGAGVVVVLAQDLDSVLRQLLRKFPNAEIWEMLYENEAGALQQSYDILAEACVHWRSNECPYFMVEKCCHSIPIEMEDDGSEKRFDGTLRVAFALREKKEARRLQETEGSDRKLRRDANGSFDVRWLGGYWKLPATEIDANEETYDVQHNYFSVDALHARIVSSFNSTEKRTAEVSEAHLQEVCNVLTPVLQAIFRAGAFGVTAVLSKYHYDKVFCASLLARMAADLRNSGKYPKRAGNLFEMARSFVKHFGVEEDPGRCVVSYIKRNESVFRMNEQDWIAAIPFLKLSLDFLPSNSSSYYLLGYCYQKMGKLQEAISKLRRSILLDPDFKSPYIALSSCFLQANRFQEAIEAGLACLRRHPDSSIAKFNVGQATYHLMSQCSNHQVGIPEQRRAQEFLDCARRNVPEQWSEQDQCMLAYFSAAADGRGSLNHRKQGIHIWQIYGWRP